MKMILELLIEGGSIMLTIIIVLVCFCIAIAVVDSVLCLSVKNRVQKNLNSMIIQTKRIEKNESIQMNKTYKMLNGSLVADEYNLYGCYSYYSVKGPHAVLDSVHYREDMDNFIDCKITYDILICNNIEIHSLGDVYKAFGLRSGEAIAFHTPVCLVLGKMFRILSSIEYDEEIIISDKAFNSEAWREIMRRELQQSSYIKKWLFTLPDTYMKYKSLMEILDFTE